MKDDLLKQGLTLIPVSEVNMTLDESKTVGYDMTVKDFYTFSTSDGLFVNDTMALFVPLSKQAQEDAKKMMRQETGTSSTSINSTFQKEVCTGLYLLTKPYTSNLSPIKVTDEELKKATDPTIPVIFNGRRTTMGKAIFNRCLPENFGFIDDTVDKGKINEIIRLVVRKYGDDVASKVAKDLETIGYKFVTIIAPSLTLDNMEIPPEIMKLKEKLGTASTEEAIEILDQMKKILEKHLNGTGLGDLINAGSSKGWAQPMQILAAKGVITDVQGNVLPAIKGSFSEGLTPTEMFQASSGARKGIVDRVINTADTGYISRQLAYLLNSVVIDPSLHDCKTKRYLTVKLTKDMIKKLTGRYVVDKFGNTVKFIKSEYKEGDVIKLRSPIFCRSQKICHTCYGDLVYKHQSPYVGVLASQLIGERGTQLIMQCTDGCVQLGNKFVPLIDFWNSIDSDIIKGTDSEIKKLPEDFKITGKDGSVVATQIECHAPHDKILFITTYTGHTILCQANHPLWIKKNNLNPNYDNLECRLIGKNEYIHHDSGECFEVTDNDVIELDEARNLKIGDAIWIDNRFAINNNYDIEPDISGYIVGKYCGGNLDTSYYALKSIVYGDKDCNKRLLDNCLDYSKKWLNDFLYGFSTSKNGIISDDGNYIQLCTTSYYLVQQIKAICLKLGYSTHVYLFDDETDIFYNSNKTTFGITIYYGIESKIMNENPIYGFDLISSIDEIKDWDDMVYDVKTETEEYMNGLVQTHNSFHCFDRNSTVEIRPDEYGASKIATFEEVWFYNRSEEIQIGDDCFEKSFEDKNMVIRDLDKWSNIKKITRHKKDSMCNMVKLTFNSDKNNYIIAQDNHPFIIRFGTSNYKIVELRDIRLGDIMQMYLRDEDKIVNVCVTGMDIVEHNDEWIYDISTDSETLNVNGMWTHNSGGAAKLSARDIISDMVKNDPDLVK